jgi:hypothetical protein
LELLQTEVINHFGLGGEKTATKAVEKTTTKQPSGTPVVSTKKTTPVVQKKEAKKEATIVVKRTPKVAKAPKEKKITPLNIIADFFLAGGGTKEELVTTLKTELPTLSEKTFSHQIQLGIPLLINIDFIEKRDGGYFLKK